MPRTKDRATPGAHLLVVDDEPVVRDLVRETLAIGDGYRLTFASDGDEALEGASRDRPDLVLLDLHLGGAMDGLEVCRRLRASPRPPQVILLTGNTRTETREACLRAGALAYLTKPFSPLELLERIEHAVETAGERPAA